MNSWGGTSCFSSFAAPFRTACFHLKQCYPSTLFVAGWLGELAHLQFLPSTLFAAGWPAELARLQSAASKSLLQS